MRHLLKVAFTIVVLGATCSGQTPPAYTISVHIPFGFVVQNDTLPAGDYRLQIPIGNPGVTMAHQMANGRETFMLQLPVQHEWSGKPQLLFDKIGNTYYLVQLADTHIGIQRVQQGKRYQEARKSADAQPVIVAAR